MKFLVILTVLFVCLNHLTESGRGKLRRRVSDLEVSFENQTSLLQSLQDQINGLSTDQDTDALRQTLQDQANAIQALQDQINNLGSCCSPVFQEIDTPDEFNYQVIGDEFVTIPGDETYFKFEVKACNDAHVLLMQGDSSTVNGYEIVIGGWENSQSVIRDEKQGTNMTSFMHSPLNCNEFRPFWVSWDVGVIRIGSGLTVGPNEFMRYAYQTPIEVSQVAISTGWKASGQWRVYDNS